MRPTILFFLILSAIYMSNISAKEAVDEESLLQLHKQLAKLTAEFSKLITKKTNHEKVKKAKKDKEQKKSNGKKNKKGKKNSGKHAATTASSEDE